MPIHSDKERVQAFLFLAASYLACLSVCIFGIFDRLLDPFAVHNDLTTSIFWMHRLTDPNLFPNDLMAQYSASRVSPAIFAIYRLGTLVTDPVTLSRFFPFGIILLLTPLTFFIGRRLAGNAGGLFTSILVTTSTWYFGPGPGTSGELAILVNCLLALALLAKNAYWLGGAVILASLAYPPSALVGGLAFALWVLTDVLAKRGNRRNFLTLFASGAVALGVLLSSYAGAPSRFGSMVTRTQMESMPEFGPQGRIPYFFGSFWERLQSGTTGIELQAPMIFLLLAAGVLLATRFSAMRKKFPLPACLFPVSGTILFFISGLLMLKLLAPSKYLVQPLAITCCCIITAGVFSIQARAFRVFTAMSLLALGVAVSYPYLAQKTDRPPAEQVFREIGKLPPDAILAGHPETMNWPPIFSKHSVHVCREGAEPYYPDYYRIAAKRVEDMLMAYYAQSDEEILQFCRESGVTHFLVIRSEFETGALETSRIYTEPIGSRVRQRIGRQHDFALLHPPDNWILYADEEAMLVAPRLAKEF